MAVDCLLLIVDDDTLNRLVVKRAVQKVHPSIPIREAGTVHEAVEILRQEPITGLISDFHLPDGTGLEILTASAKQGHIRKRLVLSGDPFVENIVINGGADWFLAKPVNLADLLAVIHRLC